MKQGGERRRIDFPGMASGIAVGIRDGHDRPAIRLVDHVNSCEGRCGIRLRRLCFRLLPVITIRAVSSNAVKRREGKGYIDRSAFLWRSGMPGDGFQSWFHATRIFASGCQPEAARMFSVYFGANCATPRRPLTRHCASSRSSALRHARRQADNRVALERAQRQQRRGEIADHLREGCFRRPLRIADDAAVVGIPLEDHQRGVREEALEARRHLPEKPGAVPENVRLDQQPTVEQRRLAGACQLLSRRRQSLW